MRNEHLFQKSSFAGQQIHADLDSTIFPNEETAKKSIFQNSLVNDSNGSHKIDSIVGGLEQNFLFTLQSRLFLIE